MKRIDDDGDRRLARLLSAAQAEPDPFLWTRARIRIETQGPAPRLVAWLGRPRALAVSSAVFAIAVLASAGLMHRLPWQQPYEVVTLTDQLITGSASEPAEDATPGAAGDSGRSS